MRIALYARVSTLDKALPPGLARILLAKRVDGRDRVCGSGECHGREKSHDVKAANGKRPA